jgi:hypothetical protein
MNITGGREVEWRHPRKLRAGLLLIERASDILLVTNRLSRIGSSGNGSNLKSSSQHRGRGKAPIRIGPFQTPGRDKHMRIHIKLAALVIRNLTRGINAQRSAS